MRAAILLAAGGSRRFGRGDKLLTLLGGRPLIAWALDRARASGAARVIMVVPSRGGRIGRFVARQGMRAIVARRHREGLGASLAAGLKALRPIEREVLIFLGDMPFAEAPRGMRLAVGDEAVRPVYRGEPGHPMMVRAGAARSAKISGDQGLAGKLRVTMVRGGAGNLIDVDTMVALRRARRCGSQSS